MFLDNLCGLKNWRVILASQSPRRVEVLHRLGLSFSAIPAEVDENPAHFSNPREFAILSAEIKANWVARRHPADLVIAADTIVVMDDQIFGKPRDAEHAREMLRKLSGTTHQVITGLCLWTLEKTVRDAEITDVTFSRMSGKEISAYLATGESFDKAGAYGIQGFAAPFIERIDGCYPNVVGFPVALFYRRLQTVVRDIQ